MKLLLNSKWKKKSKELIFIPVLDKIKLKTFKQLGETYIIYFASGVVLIIQI